MSYHLFFCIDLLSVIWKRCIYRDSAANWEMRPIYMNMVHTYGYAYDILFPKKVDEKMLLKETSEVTKQWESHWEDKEEASLCGMPDFALSRWEERDMHSLQRIWNKKRRDPHLSLLTLCTQMKWLIPFFLIRGHTHLQKAVLPA